MAMQLYFSFLVVIAYHLEPILMQAGSGSIMDMYNGMLFNQRYRKQCLMGSDMEFPCHYLQPSVYPPTSVHRLRPADIDVIVALGDSITAGTGAMADDIFEVANEYRGISFSIGGDGTWRDHLTLPNILRVFNPDLYGYANGKSRINEKPGPYARYNLAVTGAVAQDVVKQAHRLVYMLKSDPNVDYENDWKLVTLLIGHNDACSHGCERAGFLGTKDGSPENYVRQVTKALDILHQHIPRMFVSLMPAADLTILLDLHEKPGVCVIGHQYTCPCLFDPKFTQRLSRYDMMKLLRRYLDGLTALLDSGRYDTRDDFTVVLQPSLVHGELPMHRPRRKARKQPNLDYLAPDCLHWAQKTHALVARAIWNNLLEPVGEKSTSFRKDVPFLCPTPEYPYLATRKNSPGYGAPMMKSLASDYYTFMGDNERRQCPL